MTGYEEQRACLFSSASGKGHWGAPVIKYFLLPPFISERSWLTKVVKYCVEPPSMSRSTLTTIEPYRGYLGTLRTYPSSTALPKGRVELEPPKKRFQIVVANWDAWASDVNPAAPVAPPRLMVTILPFDWQVWMADARKEQSGSWVPGNTASSLTLHVWRDMSNDKQKHLESKAYVGQINWWHHRTRKSQFKLIFFFK